MAKRLHWLAGVECILRADTIDLKMLAKIAGADPATLYIGTSLDGADLRGQDLRGMQFTHLSFEKVRSNSNTQLDATVARPVKSSVKHKTSEESFEEADGLILLRSRRHSRDFFRNDNGKIHGLLVYESQWEDEFRLAAKIFKGPKFVVIDLDQKYDLVSVLDRFDTTTLILVTRRGKFMFPDDSDYQLARSLPGPVVFVPTPVLAGFGAPPLLSGAITDAIRLFIANWSLLRKLAKSLPLAVFLRGKGSGPDPIADAWCRILSNVQRAGLGGHSGVRLTFFHPSTLNIDKALFPDMEPIHVVRPRELAATVEAALLIDPRRTSRSPEAAYADAIRHLLEARGWMVSRLASREVSIQGARQKYMLDIADQSDHTVYGRLSAASDVADVDFLRIRRLFVSEEITERQLVFDLTRIERLWVTARDLCNFDASASSIWFLITQQMRRIGRSTDIVSRTQYLSLIVRTALRTHVIGDSDPQRLVDALNEPGFASRYALSCGQWRTHDGRTTCKIKLALAEDVGHAKPASLASFQLQIDSNGPAINTFSDL